MLIDTHAHLDDPRFDEDRGAVLARARQANVTHVLSIGTSVATSERNVAIASEYGDVYAVIGIQPNHVAEALPGDWDQIVRLATAPKVVAIGETGLDRHWDFSPFPLQEDYFARHLGLVRERDLPVVIHCREAETDVVRMLREDFDRHGPIRGVMHSFTGDVGTATACLAMGLHLSFAGMVTYKNAEDLRQVAQKVPIDRLLVETDSPYLTPVPLRGQAKRNEPANVFHVATLLAATRGESFADLASATSANARRLFRLPAESLPFRSSPPT